MSHLFPLIALSALASAANAQIAAQFHDEPHNLGLSLGLSVPDAGFTNIAWGQTFLSHGTGFVSTVTIDSIGKSGDSPLALTMTLWSSNGTDLENLLGTQSIDNALIPQFGSLTFDFSSLNVGIADGQRYAWALSVEHGTENNNPYGIGGNANGGYTEGTLLHANHGLNSTWDTFFSAYSVQFQVNYTVPAPTSAALLSLGGLVALRRRRR